MGNWKKWTRFNPAQAGPNLRSGNFVLVAQIDEAYHPKRNALKATPTLIKSFGKDLDDMGKALQRAHDDWKGTDEGYDEKSLSKVMELARNLANKYNVYVDDWMDYAVYNQKTGEIWDGPYGTTKSPTWDGPHYVGDEYTFPVLHYPPLGFVYPKRERNPAKSKWSYGGTEQWKGRTVHLVMYYDGIKKRYYNKDKAHRYLKDRWAEEIEKRM